MCSKHFVGGGRGCILSFRLLWGGENKILNQLL